MPQVTGLVFSVDDGNSIHRLGVAIERFHEQITDWRSLWDGFERLLEQSEAKQFSTEGRYSRRWAELSRRYAEQKRRRFGTKPILEATGKLKSGLTARGGGSYGTRIKDGDRFVFGTSNVPYADLHQKGTVKMPQRRPIDWPRALEQDVADLLGRHVSRSGRKSKMRVRHRSGDIDGSLD